MTSDRPRILSVRRRLVSDNGEDLPLLALAAGSVGLPCCPSGSPFMMILRGTSPPRSRRRKVTTMHSVTTPEPVAKRSSADEAEDDWTTAVGGSVSLPLRVISTTTGTSITRVAQFDVVATSLVSSKVVVLDTAGHRSFSSRVVEPRRRLALSRQPRPQRRATNRRRAATTRSGATRSGSSGDSDPEPAEADGDAGGSSRVDGLSVGGGR